MLYRKVFEKLRKWKEREHKKALCLAGARQVGKTTAVREFARENYKYFAEINFAADINAAEIFSDARDADAIITNLTAYLRQPLAAHETLILLDEIQECPNARTAIKFLVEDGRFDYIESGSLLGIKSIDVRSFPVGFEEIYHMYPMDFEEFAIANGVQSSTLEYLRDCCDKVEPVSGVVHDAMCRLFYSYIVVGGMPEAVRIFVETHDIGQVMEYQHNILEMYRMDISKYATNTDRAKIKAVFDAIPAQLNDRNRRYMLTRVDPNGRQVRYEDSFLWLSDAGVALPCYNVTATVSPLALNEKYNLFRLYMCDVGLLCAACMENVQFDILKGDLNVNLGSILENVIAQQLLCNGFELRYFDSKKYGEVDFIVQRGLAVEAVEVKSGQDYNKHPSLDKIISVGEWKLENAYVLCKGNVERIGKILYLPWYAVMFIKQNEAPRHLIVDNDLSVL